jgi:hypothetical protein
MRKRKILQNLFNLIKNYNVVYLPWWFIFEVSLVQLACCSAIMLIPTI